MAQVGDGGSRGCRGDVEDDRAPLGPVLVPILWCTPVCDTLCDRTRRAEGREEREAGRPEVGARPLCLALEPLRDGLPSLMSEPGPSPVSLEPAHPTLRGDFALRELAAHRLLARLAPRLSLLSARGPRLVR